MAETQDGNERKDLYRLLLNDPATRKATAQFSYKQWENKLLNDDKVLKNVADYATKKNWTLDQEDFLYKYAPEKTARAPKQQAVTPPPVEAPPMEEEAYIPEPQPVVGSPEYDAQLQAQYGGMSPTLGATFAGTPASFETKAQKKQEQISPVFKAQQLAFEDVPIAEEQRRSQREFAKATKAQQQAAVRGGTGFELSQKVADENRDATQKLKDFGSYIGATFDNMVDKAKAAEAMFGAKQRALLTFGDKGRKAEEQEKVVKQRIVDYVGQLDQEFAAKQADYNINGDLYDVISKGELDRIPEAFGYNLAQVGVQALAAATTGGYSMFAQVFPDMYKSGVEEIAKKTKTTPEQVIASGNDKELLSYIGGAISGYIEKLSGGILGKAMKSQGAYKFLRDKALDKIGKTKWKQAAASAAALGGVSAIEGATELGQGLVEVAAPQVAAADTFKEARENIYQELQKPETQRRLAGEFVGGAAGGGGIAAGGRALSRTLEGDFTYGDVRKAPQRADYDVVQIDNKIQERNKIAQAMEEAVRANPEAEGQIRQQYQKRINEAAPADDEVLMAYESLALLPETEEKNTIRENLEAYMEEKGIAPQEEVETVSAEELQGPGFQIAYAKTREEIPQEYRGMIAEVERPTTRLGRFGPMEKVFAYRVPVETIDITAPEVTTEEDITEEIPYEEVPAVTEEAPAEEIVPATGMFEGLQGPTEEQAAPEAGMFEGIAGPQAEEEVVSAAPVEEVAPEAPAAPAPKGRKKKEAPVTPAPAAPKPIEFGKQLEQKYGVRVDLLGRLDKGDLTLSRIEVPKDQRKKGVGTKVMEEIIKYADENGKRLVLSPTKEFGATSVDRLRNFYKGFGFVENKGSNKDFTIKELMYRLPSPKTETKAIPETQKEGGAKESLGKRLKGDALLDAEDTLVELSDNGATINPDGTVVVYHRTTKDKADAIVKNNEMFGLEDGVFFSTSEKGQAEGYGDVVVKMNVPIEQIEIDDTFGNEAHVRIPTKKANQKISVSKFSPQVSSAEVKPAENKEGKKAEAKEEKVTTPEFTSQQSSEAATAFDKAKTSKGFDKKYGKGAYKALSDITKNFDEIMDKVSDKIKQDCL